MWDTILFLSPPFAICLLLVGVLSYFGNHILKRGIIFIDIALAQIAALGTMIGILIGLNAESMTITFFSLGFTMLVVSMFPLLKSEKEGIPIEAVIGVTYGLSLALSITLAEKIPGGSNFIKETFTGNILWTTWREVYVSFALFFAVGVVHVIFRKKFIDLSSNNAGYMSKTEFMLLDFLFFISFAIVVVKAVTIGGIFVIFAFLIAPASIAAIFGDTWRTKVLISWGAGFVGAVLGIFFSYQFDLPNGPTIVVALGGCLIIAGLGKKLIVKLS